MSIPALATADKLFICSYVIGSDIDHRKALGIINEITTFTNEYIDGFCWIPVRSPQEENDHSWYWDLGDKDVCYVKVGVRVSADGYLHAWLTSSQEVSELILWNNRYNTTDNPIPNSTTLHWSIEKMYRLTIGNTTNFISENIKFQNYITGSTRLYLFGNYNNSLTNDARYTIDPDYVKDSSVVWYPNNYDIYLGDFLYDSHASWVKHCQRGVNPNADGWASFSPNFGKSPDQTEPLFWYSVETGSSVVIPAVCNPTDPVTKTFANCHLPTLFDGNAIGNNSGRSYPLSETGGACAGDYYDCGTSVSKSQLTIDYTGNRAYIEDPPGVYSCDPAFTYDTSASFDYKYWHTISPIAGQIDYPSADAQFSGLDVSDELLGVFYKSTNIIDTFKEFLSNDVDVLAQHGFTIAGGGSPVGTSFYTIFTGHVGIGLLTSSNDVTRNNADWTVVWQIPVHSTDDTTNIVTSDDATDQTTVNTLLNEIKGDYNAHRVSTAFHEIADNTNAVTSADSTSEATAVTLANEIKADYNAHRSQAGVHYDDDAGNTVTSSDATNLTTAIILANEIKLDYNSHLDTTNGYNYFSDWKIPDGLALRTPGTPNTLYTRPITHHDEFNVVADQPVLGGFLYEPATSNAFLSRDPGTETKSVIPICNQSDFDFLYKLVTSNAFLSRDPGTETKSVIPICNQSDFDFLYKLVTSNAFLSRDPGTEVKIDYPFCNNADFSFLFPLVKSVFFYRWHLKTTGDDTKDGLSWPEAWEHWTYMAQNVPEEGIVFVEEGIYNDAETQVGPTNSIVIFLVKNELDAVSTVTVTLV